MAQKSLFKSFLNLFTTDSGSKSYRNISADKAISLQNEYIAANEADISRSRPPYADIIDQLRSNKNEVLNAAAYYISRISRNEPSYTDDIIAELNGLLKQSRISLQNRQIIKNLIQNITPNRAE